MTSPDGSLPDGVYSGGPAGTLAGLQRVTFESAEQSILATVLGSFGAVSTASTNLNTVTRQALSTATTAQVGAAQAQSTAVAAQNTTAATSAVVAGLAAAQTGQQTGGSSFSDTFGRSSLGSGYASFKTGPVADLVINNGQVQLNSSGDEDTGNVIAVSSTVTMTDDQSVSVVMGAANQASQSSVKIVARAAADLATFAYARVYSNAVYLGYGTRAGGTTVFNDWTSATAAVNTGDTVTLEAVGANYEILVNGVPVVGYADTSVVSPVGISNRSFGFGCQYYWSGLFGYFSFGIAGIAAADLSSPDVVGTGWGLYRVSSTGVSVSSGENAVVASTFDTVRQSAGVSVNDLGRGRIAVQQAGWYALTTTLYLGSNDTGAIRADIWSAPSSSGTWSVLRTGASSPSGVFDNSVGVTSVVYLQSGSLVAPGYSITAGNTLIGPNSYFDGALLSG